MNVYRPNNRQILRITGSDNKDFLNKLITQDIDGISHGQCLYSLLLSAQGRYLHDFFVICDHADILIDVDRSKADDLVKRLTLYKMRSDIEIVTDDRVQVTILFDGNDKPAGLSCADPRHKDLGVRHYGDQPVEGKDMSFNDYETLRLSLGIPEADKDLIFEKSIPLESGLDDLNAISFTKGCYLGQELTTRTKHQGLVRKRLLPVTIAGDVTESDIFLKEKKVGTLHSSYQQKGIALIRLEVFKDKEDEIELNAGKALITPHLLDWHQI